jgi:putative transposase
MKKIRFSETQILNILNEQEQGQKVSEICRRHGLKAKADVC